MLPPVKTVLVIMALVGLLALPACSFDSAPRSESRAATRERLASIVERNGGFVISNPTLSYTGDRLAFDFYEWPRGGRRSRYMIGVYDLRSSSVEVFASPDPYANLFAPDLSSDGRRLAAVSSCVTIDCPESYRGAKIAVLDVDTARLRFVTRLDKQDHVWIPTYSADGARLRPAVIHRSSPLFSRSGDRIYYLGSSLDPTRYPNENDFSIRAVDLDSGQDRLLMSKESGAALFAGNGGLALAEDDGLIVLSRFGFGGRLGRHFMDQDIVAHHYDPVENVVTGLYGKNDLPGNAFRIDPLADSLTTTQDGRKTAYVVRGGDPFFRVVLLENGRHRFLGTSASYGLDLIGYLELSGDGRFLAVFPHAISDDGLPASFWLVNLQTLGKRRIPLSPVLRGGFDAFKAAGGQWHRTPPRAQVGTSLSASP